MKLNDLCIRLRNVAFLLFVLWLNFSPTDESPPQTLETMVTIQGGSAGSPSSETSNKGGLFGRLKNFFNGPTMSTASSNTKGVKESSNIQIQKSDALPGEKIKYSPGGSGGGNDPSIDLDEWMSPKIPDAKDTISNEFFWTTLQNSANPDSSEEDSYDCDTWDLDEYENEDLEPNQRRRLMSIDIPSSTPTAKLDQMNKKKFDFTTTQIPSLQYFDRDGRKLILTQGQVKKLTYCHQTDLGLYNPTDRIPCPLQTDPSKYQRIDCFAMNDKSVRDVIIKILEGTTTTDPSRYVTLLMPMPFYDSQLALGYLDTSTGSCIFFHADSGKLWSATRYGTRDVLKFLLDPNIVRNPDV